MILILKLHFISCFFLACFTHKDLWKILKKLRMTMQVIFFLQISSLFCVFDILQQYKYYSKLHSPFSLLGNRYVSLNLYVSWLLFRHSVMSDSVTPWTAARQASLSSAVSRSLLKFMSIKSVMPSNHLILCHPLLLLPPIPPSISVFSNESALPIRWPKCWSFSFSISPSNEHPGLISFRMDGLDLLSVQGALKSLQHYSSKALFLQHSVFFMVQLSQPYLTTGKIVALTGEIFVGKVCLCFLVLCLGLGQFPTPHPTPPPGEKKSYLVKNLLFSWAFYSNY